MEAKTDTLARRLRTAPPHAVVNRLILNEADRLIFDAIARHGKLPSSYLYQFVKHLRKDVGHFTERLTEFYNGDTLGSYLHRPVDQFDAYEARYQHAVYRN